MDVTDDWLRSLQREPKLWLRAKRGQAEMLAEKLRARKSAPLLPDAVIYDGEEDLFKTPEFHAGEFEIQDIASQVVGLLCEPQPGETWWDACAGEGGKTAAPFRPDAEQGPALGERPRGMAVAETQAARRAREGFQLSLGVLGWRREAADENEIRRRAGGRAVQRHRHLAAQSAGALDDDAGRCRELSAIQKNCWRTSRRA